MGLKEHDEGQNNRDPSQIFADPEVPLSERIFKMAIYDCYEKPSDGAEDPLTSCKLFKEFSTFLLIHRLKLKINIFRVESSELLFTQYKAALQDCVKMRFKKLKLSRLVVNNVESSDEKEGDRLSKVDVLPQGGAAREM